MNHPHLFGARLRQARLEAGFSGAQLARLVGRSQPYISDLERGQRTPSLPTLQAIAAALGKTTSYFLDAGMDEAASTRAPEMARTGASGVFLVATGYIRDQRVAQHLTRLMAEEGVQSFLFRTRWEMDRDELTAMIQNFLEETLDRLDQMPRPRIRYEDFEDTPRRHRFTKEDLE